MLSRNTQSKAIKPKGAYSKGKFASRIVHSKAASPKSVRDYDADAYNNDPTRTKGVSTSSTLLAATSTRN